MSWMSRAKCDQLVRLGFKIYTYPGEDEGDLVNVLSIGKTAELAMRQRSARLAQKHRRRARQHEAPGHASPQQIRDRIAYYEGKCWMCGCDADTIDHVIPLARGGSGWPANLRPACRSCNSRKGDR